MIMKSDLSPDRPWEEETDVIVIGSGFAGLAAAIEARLAGCDVMVLEKMKGLGGNSQISDGVVAAAGTPMQAAAGILDSPEQMVEDMMRAGLGLNRPELVQKLARESSETFRWTVEYLGVRYEDRVDQLGGHSVPRSHTVLGRSGSHMVRQLLARVRDLGIPVRTRCFLQDILRDPGCRVCGVRLQEGYRFAGAESGRPMYLRARKAVILAAGGFGNDLPFRTAQDPRLDRSVGSTNKFSTTAEVLKEAMRIGAMPVHLSWIQLGPWTSPDENRFGIGPDFASYMAFPYGVMIDPDTGGRFVNELADRKTRADAILRLGKPCIAIADQRGVECSGYDVGPCVRKGVVRRFSEIDPLAGSYGVDGDSLKATIERFNAFVEAGTDRDFGKPILKGAEPLKHPPYYGMRVWPKVHYTMGGVRIDEKARILDLSGDPIEGLFAAGEITGGVHGACRLGSCAIMDCLVFGRTAGKSAASCAPVPRG